MALSRRAGPCAGLYKLIEATSLDWGWLLRAQSKGTAGMCDHADSTGRTAATDIFLQVMPHAFVNARGNFGIHGRQNVSARISRWITVLRALRFYGAGD